MSTPGDALALRAPAEPLGPPRAALERVVVGFDASPASMRAARLALEMAREHRSRVWLVHAPERDRRLAEPLTEEEASSPARAVAHTLERLAAEAGAQGIKAEALSREGPAAEVLLRVAQEVGATAIFVGTRGLGRAERLLLGSVSGRVVVGSTVPVTVVP